MLPCSIGTAFSLFVSYLFVMPCNEALQEDSFQVPKYYTRDHARTIRQYNAILDRGPYAQLFFPRHILLVNASHEIQFWTFDQFHKET